MNASVSGLRGIRQLAHVGWGPSGSRRRISVGRPEDATGDAGATMPAGRTKIAAAGGAALARGPDSKLGRLQRAPCACRTCSTTNRRYREMRHSTGGGERGLAFGAWTPGAREAARRDERHSRNELLSSTPTQQGTYQEGGTRRPEERGRTREKRGGASGGGRGGRRQKRGLGPTAAAADDGCAVQGGSLRT